MASRTQSGNRISRGRDKIRRAASRINPKSVRSRRREELTKVTRERERIRKTKSLHENNPLVTRALNFYLEALEMRIEELEKKVIR